MSETVNVLVGVLGGAGAGTTFGLLVGAGICFYREYLHRQDLELIENRHVAATSEIKLVYKDMGRAVGKQEVQTFNYIHSSRGVFGPRLKTLFVVYDAGEKRVMHLAGNVSDYRIFAGIPPHIMEGITRFLKTSAVKLLAA